jgi:hypothetical protein
MSACEKLYSSVCMSTFALAAAAGVEKNVLVCSRKIGDPAVLEDYAVPNYFASWKGTPLLRPDSYDESINGVSATVKCINLVKEGGLDALGGGSGGSGGSSGAPTPPPKCPKKVCKEPMILRRLPMADTDASVFFDESEETWAYCNVTDDCTRCQPSCYMPCPVRPR